MTSRQIAALATKKKLLDAGSKIIAEKGLSQATVDEITALAGVSKGTFYTYFKKKEDIVDITENDENNGKQKNEMEDAMAQTNKMMSWMMPIMSISIAFVAPLGLALYWLINNILMILERLILDKAIKQEEEE